MTTEIQDLSEAEAKALAKVPGQYKETVLETLRDYQANALRAFKKKKVNMQLAKVRRLKKLKRKTARKARQKNRK